ncbi:hypothetical protein Tco_0608337 [Tanacetum coccineum]
MLVGDLVLVGAYIIGLDDGKRRGCWWLWGKGLVDYDDDSLGDIFIGERVFKFWAMIWEPGNVDILFVYFSSSTRTTAANGTDTCVIISEYLNETDKMLMLLVDILVSPMFHIVYNMNLLVLGTKIMVPLDISRVIDVVLDLFGVGELNSMGGMGGIPPNMQVLFVLYALSRL